MFALQDAIAEHLKLISSLPALADTFNQIVGVCHRCLKRGGTIYFIGNGGSAADAQHLAAELVGRFKLERRALSAVALTTDTSNITAIGNDYNYSYIFARQVEALVRKGDVLIGLSTSGNSENVKMALVTAHRLGADTIAFLGNGGGKIAGLVNYALIVPSGTTARIQEAHILIGHTLCEELERLEVESAS